MDLDSCTEDQVRLLCDSRNRAILDVLDGTDGTLHLEELADRLVSRDVTVVDSSEYEDRIDETCISLHHERLPKLAESDLLEYDPDAKTIVSRPSTAPDVEWQDDPLIEAIVTHLPTSHGGDEGGIGVLDGRGSIIQYGRQLADVAEEELFCMYVSTNLLEDECIRRAEDAVDRGVTMYVGSQNAEVRELTRSHLPEATIWEPQLDWLNTPTAPRVGRLVLVDRRRVMLAILEDPVGGGGSPEETALVGHGTDNPLVVLVRELLGPRLDHLDYQSVDFQNELPSRQ